MAPVFAGVSGDVQPRSRPVARASVKGIIVESAPNSTLERPPIELNPRLCEPSQAIPAAGGPRPSIRLRKRPFAQHFGPSQHINGLRFA